MMIKCPNCGQSVPFGRFCYLCNTPLSIETNEFEGLDAYGFYDRAQGMWSNMKRTQLVRIQALKVPGDGSLPHTKPIHVEDGTRLFLYSSSQPRPVQLMPGTYSPQDLFSQIGLATSIQPFEDQSWCCFCWVRTQPISTVVALPDPPLMREALTHTTTDITELMRSVAQAVRKLGLVDRDNQMGGANLQMELRCIDPARFMDTIVQDYIEDNRHDLETRGGLEAEKTIRARKVPAPVVPRPPEGLLATLGRWVKKAVGIEEKVKEKVIVGPPSELIHLKYSMFDLYNAIHMEFRAAIQDGIREMTARDLFENRNNIRERVAERIQTTMQVTLHNYGLAIGHVAAFEFICPEFTRMREKESKIREAEQNLILQAKTGAINDEAARLAQAELVKAEGRDKDLEKGRLSDRAEVGTLQDQLAQAALLRKQEAERIGNVFSRTEKVEDSRVHLEIDRSTKEQELALEHVKRTNEVATLTAKMRAAADIQKELNQQEHEQLKGFIEMIGGLDPATMQLLIAARNPQLAALWTASQQHAAQQKIIELQQQNQAAIKDAHSQSSQEISDFMKQVAALFAQVVNNRIPGPAKPMSKLGNSPVPAEDPTEVISSVDPEKKP